MTERNNTTAASEAPAERIRFTHTVYRDLGHTGATLTDKEMMLLLDAANGCCWAGMLEHPSNAKACLSGFRDDPDLEAKWNVDGQALANKLTSLTDAQACFLGGFLRGWWQRQGESETA